MRIRHNILSYFSATLHELLTFYYQVTNKHLSMDKFLIVKISNCESAYFFKKKVI
ncbi:hypothetical protein AY601_4212 [Pedobacter cryoconitis]|uniref:Uncharacterized protein n=1 Tax=Pedobacter cryoconitis TaxID=188932 RepID=A0A127VIN8_9SPHI|nr:hypothetical protein AY601_4212 [Pedobacter cryoconitis]